MNILISTIVWGKSYFNNFCDYSLPSLLSKHNAPALVFEHAVTFIILTEHDFIEIFKKKDIYKHSCHTIHYEFFTLEEYGFNLTRVPSGYHEKKYQFLSVCQNIIIDLSKKYDIHIFNYADFIWSDNSLVNVIAKFQDNDIFALNGFCVPVDEKTVKPKLLSLKKKGTTSLELDNYYAVSLALEHLHSEAKLHQWSLNNISNYPSYLYWDVLDEGIIIRAFHQTLLATAPTRGSCIYNEGITQGTLDSHFALQIAEVEKTMIAADSEEIFVFSMFKFYKSSQSKTKKEDVLRTFVNTQLSKQHLVAFQTPILLKRNRVCDQQLWEILIKKSINDVAFFCSQKNNATLHCDLNLESLAIWKNPKRLPYLVYFSSGWIIPKLRHLAKRIVRQIWQLMTRFHSA